ncbi:hypothetical protein BH11CYA1_BH11CYA1_15610 [soil metagenome]
MHVLAFNNMKNHVAHQKSRPTGLSLREEQLFDEAQTWQSAATNMFLAGQLPLALTYFRNALAKLQSLSANDLEAEVHINIGCVLAKLGDKATAKAEFASAVLILERIMGGTGDQNLIAFARFNLEDTQRRIHSDKARKLMQDAHLLLQKRNPQGARAIIEEAINLAEHGARDVILHAQLLNQLAWTFGMERQYKQGLMLLQQACKLLIGRRDKNSKSLFLSLKDNIRHFREVKKESPVLLLLEQATSVIEDNLFEQGEATAMKAAERCRRILGADHPHMPFALHKLGFCQLMLGDDQSARRNLLAAKALIGKWPKFKDEAVAIDFTLAWTNNDGDDFDFDFVRLK